MISAKAFTEFFGGPPEQIASVPGRVNLIGEHVDYNGGTVLPMAVTPSVTIALAPNKKGVHRLASTRFSETTHRMPGSQKQDNWTDYIVGALAAAETPDHPIGTLDVLVESTLPDGAGLSSSAALITAVLKAAETLSGASRSPIERADAARAVENRYIGVPCGIMDQMAVGLCQPGQALALNTVDSSYELITVPDGWGIAIVHSGVRRQLNDGRYEQRFLECAAAKAALNVEHLCLMTAEQYKRREALEPALAARVRHVCQDHRRTVEAIRAMEASDLAAFGNLMTLSHWSYSRDFEASTPEIDQLVSDAVEIGASGARLTGGGFGGCIVAVMPAKDKEEIVSALLKRHQNAWSIQ